MLSISIIAASSSDCIIGSSDFSSRSFDVTFYSGDKIKSLNIPVYKDNIVEFNETFNIVISLSPFLNVRIKVDKNNAIEGHIVDSTGKSSVCI